MVQDAAHTLVSWSMRREDGDGRGFICIVYLDTLDRTKFIHVSFHAIKEGCDGRGKSEFVEVLPDACEHEAFGWYTVNDPTSINGSITHQSNTRLHHKSRPDTR